MKAQQFRLAALLAVAFLAQGALAQPAEIEMARPDWISFDEALTAAQTSGKLIVVDVWSRRCGWCRKMQEEVYTRPELLGYLNEHFETGRLDIDVKTDTLKYMGYELSSADLSVGFGASGTPTTIFLTNDGNYITRLPGFHAFEDYMPVLKFIGSESYRDMTFEDFMADQTK